MSKIKVGLLIVFFASMQMLSLAQNNTNSPYTRYGYGQLADQAFGGQRAMGGIGYGLRKAEMINPLNPASFSNIDSMTFMIDMGLTAQLGWYSDGTNKSRKINANLEYVAIQFPLYKGLGMGIGFEPISHVGYNYGSTQVIDETSGSSSSSIFKGTGGLSDIYAALSYNMFHRFSLGVDVGYMFGDIRHDRQIAYSDPSFSSVYLNDTLRMNGLVLKLGAQYIQPMGKDQRLVVGAVYSPKMGVSGTYMRTDLQSAERLVSNYGFDMPQSIGVGFTYNKINKLTLGADFLAEQWADARYYGKTDSLKNRTKVSVGGEYIPDSRNRRSYFKQVRYRAGMHYSDSYVTVQNSGYNEYGASVGLGFPVNDGRSLFNVAFEYVKIKPEVATLIDEQYFKFTFSYTFNELWFHKRKVQ